uniref:histone acetyltransferase n=1 Tax=Blastobotrys adeninivorans TaxID=409370 RepID=A0A060SYU9_BLAAD
MLPNRFPELEDALPEGANEFQLIHLKTKLRKCRRLVYKKPKSKGTQEYDRVTPHLFILAYEGLAVFAMEAFLYEGQDDSVTTLFVSKADTTGHYYGSASLSIARVTRALIRVLLRYYAQPADKVRVCLFAKAENQYLFPLSSKNPKKHVQSDASLVKWWLRVLDPLKDEFGSLTKARLQIPGADSKAIEAFFPRPSTMDWSVGDVFSDNGNIAAVKCIPRFPDDPKVRFLDYLVSERRALKTPREQFWIELQARQEFRLGSVVGIIGIEGTLPSRNEQLRASVAEPHEVRYRKLKTLREALVSCDYSTIESAKDAHDFLTERITTPFSILTIKGKHRAQQKRPADAAVAAPINTLSGGMVRKKAKKTSS